MRVREKGDNRVGGSSLLERDAVKPLDGGASGPARSAVARAFSTAFGNGKPDHPDSIIPDIPASTRVPDIVNPPHFVIFPGPAQNIACPQGGASSISHPFAFKQFQAYSDPWAVLRMSPESPYLDPQTISSQTKSARHLNKIDDADASDQAREWHETQRLKIIQAGALLNRDYRDKHGHIRSASAWKSDVENAWAARARFLAVAHEYQGRTLLPPPVGEGYAIDSIRCPDSSCKTCRDRISDFLLPEDFDDYEGSAERGCAVGLYKRDPVRAMRIVYACISPKGELTFTPGRYTRDCQIGPPTSVGVHNIQRSDIAPFGAFPFLVSTRQECLAFFQSLQSKGNLPGRWLSASPESLLVKLSRKDRRLMADWRQLYRNAVEMLFPLIPSGWDTTTGRPLFDRDDHKHDGRHLIPLGIGGVEIDGSAYVVKVPVAPPQTYAATEEDKRFLDLYKDAFLPPDATFSNSVEFDAPDVDVPDEIRERNSRAQTDAAQETQQPERRTGKRSASEMDASQSEDGHDATRRKLSAGGSGTKTTDTLPVEETGQGDDTDMEDATGQGEPA